MRDRAGLGTKTGTTKEFYFQAGDAFRYWTIFGSAQYFFFQVIEPIRHLVFMVVATESLLFQVIDPVLVLSRGDRLI